MPPTTPTTTTTTSTSTISTTTTCINQEFVSPHQCSLVGQCVESTYIGRETATEENQCISLCKSDPHCKWSSLNPIKEDCTMFSDCKQINATQCEECLTNERSCVPKQCNVNGKCEVSSAHYFILTYTIIITLFGF